MFYHFLFSLDCAMKLRFCNCLCDPSPPPSPCTTVMSCTPNVWSQSLITSHLIKKLYTSWGTVKALLTRKIKFPNSVATASFAVSCGDLFSIQSPEGKNMSAKDRTARGLKDQIHVTELKYKGWLYCFISFFLKLALCVSSWAEWRHAPKSHLDF